MQEIISSPANFDVFQLVCSECCSPLKVKWDQCGLAFVEGCTCKDEDFEDEVETEGVIDCEKFYVVAKSPKFHRG